MVAFDRLTKPKNPPLVIRMCWKLAEPTRLSETTFSVAWLFLLAGAVMCVMCSQEKFIHHVIRDQHISFELVAPPAPRIVPRDEAPRTLPANFAFHQGSAARNTNGFNERLHDLSKVKNYQAASQESTSASRDLTSALEKAPVAMVTPETRAFDPAAGQAPGNGSNSPGNQNGPVQTMPAAGDLGHIGDPAGSNAKSGGSGNAVEAGQTDMQSVAGDNFGLVNKISRQVQKRSVGNIGPYVRDLRLRVASNWLAPQSFPGLIVLHLTLSHDGALLNSEVRESSGSKRFDDKVLASVKATQFAPLPEWYHGNSLDIDLKLDTITQ